MELSCSSDYLADAKVIKFSFLSRSSGIIACQVRIYLKIDASQPIWYKAEGGGS